MAGLGTVVILLALGVSGASGDSPPPAEAPAPAPPPAEVPAPLPTTETPAPDQPKPSGSSSAPAPPIEYLKAGILFFNTGKYEEAGKYLEAAQRFRDQLKDKERIVLDVYRDELAAYQDELRRAAAETARGPGVDPGVVQASRVTVEPSKKEKPPEPVPALISRHRAGVGNKKDEGRWVIHEAREQIRLGKLDEAERRLAQVRSMKLDWGILEDNPDKLAKDLEYVRKHKPQASKPTDSDPPVHDLPTARTKLLEAREALTRNDVNRAEAIAREVQSWKLDASQMDESPDKILATIRSIRLAETIRKYGGELPANTTPTPR